jgi:hypothetical protein
MAQGFAVKSRNAAALALWLLMQPPWVGPEGGRFDANAPLSKWKASISFRTPEKCNEVLSQVVQFWASHPEEKNAAPYHAILSASKCVADDAPRLKEK